ncbi:hypothetical protein MTO96_003711 [Rhipicephalus appendiculatus]
MEDRALAPSASSTAARALAVSAAAATVSQASALSLSAAAPSATSAPPPGVSAALAAARAAAVRSGLMSVEALNAHPPQIPNSLPSYYNPTAVNALKYTEQMQKRKLLWKKPQQDEVAAETEAPNPQPNSTCAKVWEKMTFAQDDDGKMTAKFRKLMDIRGDPPPPAEKPDPAVNPLLKQQEKLFQDLDQQYEAARERSTASGNHEDTFELIIPDMSADALDSAAESQIKPAGALAPSSAPTEGLPLPETSIAYRRDKKTRFSIPSLQVASPLVATSTRKRTWILRVAAISTFIAFVVGAALILVYWLGSGNRAEEDLFCESDDCRHHEALIGERLNRSIDPCADFSAFVCSAWMASSVYREGSLSTQQDVVGTWSVRFDSLLSPRQVLAEASKKALGMLELCQNRPNETVASGIQALRKFMDERSLSWPIQPNPNVHPIGVLLDLDLNWAMALWFHVRLLPMQSGGKRAMVVSPAASITKQFKFHRKLVYSGAFFDYWRNHYELLAPPGAVPATETESKREEKVQTFVLQELLEASRALSVTQILLKDIEKNVTKISLKEWIHFLNKNLQMHPEVTGEDRIIVTHDMLLYSIDKITTTHENSEIVQNIAWLFLLAVGPIADFALLEPSGESVASAPRDRKEVSAERAAFCAAQVEWTYRFLIISLYTLANFPSDERKKLDARLRIIREAALDKVATATRVDRLSKRRAQEKLNATLTVLWPPENLIDESSISIMYADFPKTDNNFATLWLRLRESFHNISKNKMYDDALHMPHNLALPLLDYDYILNTIRISVQALSAPVFYAHGTRAMFYGGLGFLYASQLVRALDRHGLRINGSGHITGLWLSSAWRHAVNDVDKCLGGYVSHFPEIPALEVSYDALERALGQGSDSHQRLHDGFTERQLFFVTLCFLMCSRPGADSTGDCNKAVMNFPPFARNFGRVSVRGRRKEVVPMARHLFSERTVIKARFNSPTCIHKPGSPFLSSVVRNDRLSPVKGAHVIVALVV